MWINLGECVKQLEKAIEVGIKDRNGNELESREIKDLEIRFDFPGISCSGSDSYRGYYDELSLEPCIENGKTAKQLLEILKRLKDKKESRHGYKGGEYWYSKTTPVWVAPHGETSNKAISGINYDGYWGIVIHTCDRES